MHSQVTLDADGPGQTYELITSILAPGHNPIEAPGHMDSNCDNHSSYDRHISEVFDTDLNDYIFKFDIHVAEDNDRCKNFDRQRNEIKTYDQSPDNLLGIAGETVEYRWKFKLDDNFQPSSSFTHIHQLKAVGGTEDSMPLITLTARKANPDRLELRYAETTTQVTLSTADLSLFKGNWVEIIETVKYGESGVYTISISDISTGNQLFTYSDPNIRMWKTEADFIRPKWGIYRSLNNASQLRDETVLFANFSINEDTTLSINEHMLTSGINIFPNPTEGIVHITSKNNFDEFYIDIHDITGKIVQKNLIPINNIIDISQLKQGIYFMKYTKQGRGIAMVHKVLKK